MRNFARIIDLKTCECCCYRVGTHEIQFVFWMRDGRQVLSPSLKKTYPTSWVIDSVFEKRGADMLKDEAEKALEVVLRQMELHSDQLADNVPLVLDGETIDKLFNNSDFHA